MALRRSARLDAEVEPFDIHQVMNDSLLITGHRLRTHEVELEMTSHAVLLGHASHIGQVFTNLLSNAADALDGSDGEAGRVRIAIYDDKHEGVPSISVIVEDSGPGSRHATSARPGDLLQRSHLARGLASDWRLRSGF